MASDKKSGKAHYITGYPSSPKLKEAADAVAQIKMKIRSLHISQTTDEPKLTILEAQLKQANMDFRENQRRSKELRITHLEELAQKRSELWKLTAAQAATIINESEKSKAMHRKHRYYLKSDEKGGIKHILVPWPRTHWKVSEKDLQTAACQMRVDNPTDIFNILLRQNFNQLLKSDISPFTKGELREKVGENAEKEYTQEILRGLDQEKIKNDFNEGKDTLHNFIKAMKIPTNKNGKKIEPFKWTYGVDEYKRTFSKTRETTACGPSGLHMSHWKAALQRERIMKIHAFFIWADFEYGFYYERWETSWNFMIQKRTTHTLKN